MTEPKSHYTVLARRFRPQTFEDVVGQDTVAQALRNAICSGRVAHAYLFTGARGVGKTSMARILAKALNCPNAKDAVPCNACDICHGISAGNDVDVLEIDGASNRGIDDIRTLRANVTVKSMRTKYKIYIIDEVHMLTKDAFNALLKTLEEPPPNVKFVFCTTEPNKVPDTILSRCQRFDFGTIATARIVERLTQIAHAEKVDVDTEALELVARRATGSMRDSQSLFDQLLAFGENHISAADVHRLFGTATDARLIELANALAHKQRNLVLTQLDDALNEGVQLGELVNQLVYYLRDLMVLGADGERIELLSVSNAHRTTLKKQADLWGLQTIVSAMQILGEAQVRMQRTTSGRALVELALVQISLLEDLQPLDDLIARLESENSGRQTAPPVRSTARKSSPVSNRRPSQTVSPHDTASQTEVPITPQSANSVETTAPEPKPARPSQKKTSEAAMSAAQRTVPNSPNGDMGSENIHFEQGNEPVLWAQVVSTIDDMIKDHLNCVSNVAISGPNKLELTFPRSYHFSKQYCERPEILRRLELVVSGIAGKSIQLSLSVADEGTTSGTGARLEVTNGRRVPDELHDPFVQEAVSLFHATVVKVEDLPQRPERKE